MVRELSAMLILGQERKFDQGSSPCCIDVPDDLAMDSTGDTVLQLEVHLGNSVLGEYRCIRDIT